jgi:hypothetical protein
MKRKDRAFLEPQPESLIATTYLAGGIIPSARV